jgi:2-polyprenyl-6-methoxyphenol hydroxylase-like FAD-dependent oxidoreductase
MAKTRRVIIFGAGKGDWRATVAFRQRGFEVEVYEQSPTLAEIGAAINITRNGAKVLNVCSACREKFEARYGKPASPVSPRQAAVSNFDTRLI